MGSDASVKVALGERASAFPAPRHVSRRNLISAAYLFLLLAVTVHVYRTPIYSMDSIQYMGNALLMEERDPFRIHTRVYEEINRFVPQPALAHLLGDEPGAPADQNASRRARARDAYIYSEFLPLFAIRPAYNQVLWLTAKIGPGLVRAGILISAASYYLLGVVLFAWLAKYLHLLLNLAVSLVLMITPPLLQLGRETTSDALATLVAFAALYLILEKNRLLSGFTLLLASIYFRTDFVVLAAPVILACWLQKRVDLWKGFVLLLLAVASVLTINHFAGDYGIKMLYYRNFIAVPTNPGEMTVNFALRDYLSSFRTGMTLLMESFFLPFLLLGLFGLSSTRARALFAVSTAYVLLHFLVLPNWQERWVGVFYLSMTVSAAMAQGQVLRGPTSLG